MLSLPPFVYFLHPGFEINTALVSFLIAVTEYLTETAEQGFLVAHGLRDTFYRGREGGAVGDSNCNISVNQRTSWDQVSSALEALYLPGRLPELKGSRTSQKSVTSRELSIQIHEPVGDILHCCKYNKLSSGTVERD